MREVTSRTEGEAALAAVENAMKDWGAFFLAALGFMCIFIGPTLGPEVHPAVLHWWTWFGFPMAAAVAFAGVVCLALVSRRLGTAYPSRLTWWLVAPASLVALAALFPASYFALGVLHEADMLVRTDGYWSVPALLIIVTLPGSLFGYVLGWSADRRTGPRRERGEMRSVNEYEGVH